jgi:hypothetical protein
MDTQAGVRDGGEREMIILENGRNQFPGFPRARVSHADIICCALARIWFDTPPHRAVLSFCLLLQDT